MLIFRGVRNCKKKNTSFLKSPKIAKKWRKIVPWFVDLFLGHQGSATWQFRPRLAPEELVKNVNLLLNITSLNVPFFQTFFGWVCSLKFDIFWDMHISSIVAVPKSCLLFCQAQIHRIVPQCFDATAVATNAKLSGSKLAGKKNPWTRMKTKFYSCENI